MREAVGPAGDTQWWVGLSLWFPQFLVMFPHLAHILQYNLDLYSHTYRVSFQNWFHFICICEVMII